MFDHNPNPVPGSAPQPGRPGPLVGGNWLRVSLMGVFLALIMFVAFFYRPSGAEEGAPVTVDVINSTPVPELDPEIMAQVDDAERAGRLKTENEPLELLLEKSLAVTPAVARKLQMPEHAVAMAALRSDPAGFRGRYLWFKGELEYLSKPKPGHPVAGYDYYEARLRTEEGDHVLARFSVVPEEGVKVGSWVRMEGYFLKLRDAHLPVPLNKAPLLVGPELFPAYAKWEPVVELDHAILDQVRDGEWQRGTRLNAAGVEESYDIFDPAPDIEKMLVDSQDEPLWHLGSYAEHRKETVAPEVWRKVPAFVTKDQFDKYRRGETPRGTPVRLLGTLLQARVMPARINPVGLDSWTEVWIQIRDLGGKTFPVWVPGAIDTLKWRRNQTVVFNAYFFKRYRYETVQKEVRWTPLFVSADLKLFELKGGALSNHITMGFAGLAGLVTIIFFLSSRRDRRRHERHEAHLVERRRRRRSAGAVGQQA